MELVSNSYAGGMVEGIWVVGGLVGLNQSGLNPSSGLIVNIYADGDVSGSYNVGGLVGENRMRVENSYASGAVSGYSFVGGLVGRNAGSIVAGYWDQEASGVNTSDGSPDENGLATNELQASVLFEGWSSEHWDFTTGHYPVLKYIVGDDDAHPACDDGTSTGDNTDLPSCATVLSGQLPPYPILSRGIKIRTKVFLEGPLR